MKNCVFKQYLNHFLDLPQLFTKIRVQSFQWTYFRLGHSIHWNLFPLSICTSTTLDDLVSVHRINGSSLSNSKVLQFQFMKLTAKFIVRVSILINPQGLIQKHSTYQMCQKLCCKVVMLTGMTLMGQFQGRLVEWSYHKLQKDSRW